MRKTQFTDGEYYHVFNRGVDKRKIFLLKQDYRHFLFHLTACNDERPLDNSARLYRGLASLNVFLARWKSRKPYVSILCFCLLPNHFHLLLKQHGDTGVPQFMQKLSTAYTMYFNTKQKRVGSLFQGPYKAIHIKDEEYLTHLSRYIHLNPLDLKDPEWREQGVRSPLQARRFLQNYPWSSYQDYLEYNTHPYLLDTTLLREIIGPSERYARFIEEWAGIEYLDEVSPLVNED